MEATQVKTDSQSLVHVHVCHSCGRASRREDRDGTPDAFGVFHCSSCGHEGPLRVQIMSESDVDVHR
jgi:ribosomal protein L37AE/L43A